MTGRLTRGLCTVAVALALGAGPHVATMSWAQSTPGTWTHFPPQQTVYKSVIRPPIKANGTSTFSVGSVVPVKFKLLSGAGVFLFDSVWSNNVTPEGGEGILDDDFAFLTFTPSNPMTFADVQSLIANYSFTMGNCQGGSLRWSVTFDIGEDDDTIPPEGEPDPHDNDRSIFIYYGGYPNFTDCTTSNSEVDVNQSGDNMIGLSDLRYDTSQIGGTFYDSYANALALAGPQTGEVPRPALKIASISLVLDSGWMQDEFGQYKDQSVALTSASVNGNAFVPVPSADPTATCTLPPALITVVEDVNGPANPATAQFKLNDSLYRNTNECTYSYNLATSSLFGPGHYSAYVVIGSQIIFNPGQFTLH